MIKILHIIQGLSLGGGSRAMIAAAKYSSRLGNFHHSILSLLPPEHEAVELANAAAMHVINASDRGTLLREIENADIVHMNFWNNPEMYELLRSDLPEMRLLIWFHIAGDRAPQILTQQLIDFSDVALACSPYTYRHPLLQNLPENIKHEKTGMVYGAADFERVSHIRMRPHNTFNVGYIGTVDFVKLHRNYVSMSAAIDVPGIKFIVCGGGIQEFLRQEALQLGAIEKFDFRGYVKDIKSVIEILDVYGYPLCEETYAAAELNLQEIMYAGIPPVVFPYGGLKHLVSHEQTGLIVKSEGEYKQAVEYLYHNPAERLRLGQNAKTYAQQIFGAGNAAKELNPIYERMMRQPKRKHFWGMGSDVRILDRPISLADLMGTEEKLSGSNAFVESLGDKAQDFIDSINSQDIQTLFEAEKNIANSPPVLISAGGGGIFHYRRYYPDDAFLKLWAGLVLQKHEQYSEALSEYLSAANSGFKHYRIYWYISQAAEKAGNNALAQEALERVHKADPSFAEELASVKDKLHKTKERPLSPPSDVKSAPSEILRQKDSASDVKTDSVKDSLETILIATNIVPFKDPGQIQRQNACIESISNLKSLDVIPLNICFKDEYSQPSGWNVMPVLKRSADIELKIKGKRKPFVTDLFNIASEWAEKNGIQWFAISNSDIIFSQELIRRIRKMFEEGYDTLAASRTDIVHIDPATGQMQGYLERYGQDVFICQTKWWKDNRHLFQPYIFGERAWDNAFAAIMACHSRFHILYEEGLCYHIKHETNWLTGPYADYNLSIYNGIDWQYQSQFTAFIMEVLPMPKELLTFEKTADLIKKYFKKSDIPAVLPDTVSDGQSDNAISLLKASDPVKQVEKSETTQGKDAKNKVRVSAIVSTYNSERFIRGCLEDLIHQTLYQKGELEIIVANSGSLENEETIVKEFQSKYSNLSYIKTTERESLYAAWNRGIKAASGKYITNANADDRHRSNAFEIMAKELDDHPNVVLVYADSIITRTENETFDRCTPVGYFALPEYDRVHVLHGSCIGPQPMWRKQLHDELGYFDESLKVAGDYEWWLRISEKYPFKHIPELLGLYLIAPQSIEHSNEETSSAEAFSVRDRYAKRAGIRYDFTNYGKPFVVRSYPPADAIKVHAETPSSMQTKKSTFAAVYCVYDDTTWLTESLESIYSSVDFVYFLISDRPWYGQPTGNTATLETIRRFPDIQNKIKIVQGSWTNETDQRNAGLDILREAGFAYCCVIDADEIYDPGELKRMTELVVSRPEADCWHVHLDTYWKIYRYRIDPREPLTPPLFVKTEGVRFIQNRTARGRSHMVIPPETGICHHLSYARSDKEVLQKITTFSHAHEVKPDWFENIWKRWDADHSLTDLHPTHPHNYQRAVEQPYSALPPVLKRRYLQEEKIGGDVVAGLTSIIILAHNQWVQTDLCLRSVERYTPEPHEIIFVDNGSNDETGARLRSLLKTRTNLKVITNRTNRGFAAGNNQGIALAQGEYILLLNNDTIVPPGWLRRMLDVFSRYPDTGIVGPMSNYVSGPQLIPNVQHKNTDEMEAFAARWAKDNEGQSFPIHRVVGFCLLAKREVFDRVGGLDEQFGSGNFEDDDFCLRVSLAGYKARVAQDAFIHHTGNITFKALKIDIEKNTLRNWEIFKSKWRIPQDTPYRTAYHKPSQIAPGESMYIALPYLTSEHKASADKRWWQEIKQKEEVMVKEKVDVKKDLTSIVLLCSDGKDHLRKCLDSIRKHTKPAHEIIFVFSDPSLEPPKWLCNVIRGNAKNYRLLKCNEKAGFSKACNMAIEKSSGKHIVIMDDAVVVTEDWLSGMLECLNSSDDTGIVGPVTVNVEGRQGIKVDESRFSLRGKASSVIARSALSPVIARSALSPVIARSEAVARQSRSKPGDSSLCSEQAPQSQDSGKDEIAALPPVARNDMTSREIDVFAKSFRERNRHRRVEVKSVGSFCMLFRHDLTGRIGLFDEQFGIGDNAAKDYCFTTAMKGFRNMIAGDVFIDFYGHKSKRVIPGAPSPLNKDRRILIEKWLSPQDATQPESKKKFTMDTLFLADELSQKGEKGNAILALQEAIKSDPEDQRLYYTVAEILIGENKFREALESIDKMPEWMKKESKALELTGVCKEGMRQSLEAEKYADEVLRYNASSPVALNLKGVVAFTRILYPDAEGFFRRALDADPGYGEAYTNLGSMRWQQGKKEEAFGLFEKAFILNPTNEDILTNYYAAASYLSKLPEVEKIFREAIALYPSNRRLQFVLIDNLLQQNRFEEAMKSMEEAMITFGIDDDTLAVALKLREKVGVKEIVKEEIHRDTVETKNHLHPNPPPSMGREISDASNSVIAGSALSPVIARSASSPVIARSEATKQSPGDIEKDKIATLPTAARNDRKESTISLCMIVKNEEKNIMYALRSVKPAVDEMIVVDTGSTDRTKNIAKVFGAKVYDFPWADDFSAARNFSLSKASGDWIFILDADEVISSFDYEKLRELITEKGPRGQGVSPQASRRGDKDSSEIQKSVIARSTPPSVIARSEATKQSPGETGKDEIATLPTVARNDEKKTSTPRTLDSSAPAVAYAFVTRNYVGAVSMNWQSNDGQYKEEAGSGWFPSTKVRLFPRDPQIRFENPVHETVENSLLMAGVEVKKVDMPIHHYGKLKKEEVLAKGEHYYQLGKIKIAGQGERDPKALHELAVQASELEKFDEAIEYWKELISVEPYFAKAYYGLGTCLYHLSRYNEAVTAFEKAIQLDPHSKDSARMHATCEILIGNVDAAIYELENILQKEPDYSLALHTLASAYLCAGKKEKGLEYFRMAQNTQFSIMPYIASMAKTLLSGKRFDYACRLLEALEETGNATNETQQLLEECRIEKEKVKVEAEAKVERRSPRSTRDDTKTDVIARSEATKQSHTREDSEIATLPTVARNDEKETILSLCMIVKNEEENIERALMSVKHVVDEMIVVDTGSADRTKEIAERLGARVFEFPWTGSFSDARNFAISKASGEWILILDADESISFFDHDKLKELIIEGSRGHGVMGSRPGESPEATSENLNSATRPLDPSKPALIAYSFTTRNYVVETNTAGWISNDGKYFLEEAGTGWYPGEKVRLFPRDSRFFFEFPVHERIEPSLMKAGISIRKSGIPVHHYGKLNKEKARSKAESYYLLAKKKLAESTGNDPMILYEMAIQGVELGKYEEAQEYLRKVIALKPNFSKAYQSMGNIYYNLGKYEEALPFYKKALGLDPGARDTILMYATTELLAGSADKAIPLLEKFLEDDPSFPQAMLVIAEAYFCTGKAEEGLPYMTKLKDMHIDAGRSITDFARLLISNRQFRYALTLLQTAVDADAVVDETNDLLTSCRKLQQGSSSQGL